MSEDRLRDIDTLRERADLSYEEASALLERYDGDVVQALVELESQGRSKVQHTATGEDTRQQSHGDENGAAEKAASFVKKAFQTQVVVEKRDNKGDRERIANVSAPIAAGLLLAAPWFSIAAAGIAYATGFQLKLEKTEARKEAQQDA